MLLSNRLREMLLSIIVIHNVYISNGSPSTLMARFHHSNAEEVGKKVSSFYNKTPFPDYELGRFNSKEDLRLSAYSFAKIMDRSIPESASVIDVGTGTGQLSAFLSLRRACVYGIDFSDGSLDKARKLKDKLNLDTWHLKKVNLLARKEIDDIGIQFDYVLCLGVLHHTADPYGGFQNILRLLKPNGHIAVGLYNRFGRIPLKVRILLAKTIFKNNKSVQDRFIKMQLGDVEDKERARGWWNDQYCHPHESTHTVGEVLGWFKKNNIKFLQSVPTLELFDESVLEVGGVWRDSRYPHLPVRMVKQLAWIYTTHHEGGYWIMFGKKK